MAGIKYFRPIGFDERDADLDDLPRICPECETEYDNDGELLCPECRAVDALNEDRGIDQVLEDNLSPPIEE